MPQSSAVSHLVFARARAGKSEQLGERLLTLIAPSRSATGCLDFTLQRSMRDADLWLISGCWTSEDTMNTWLGAPDVQVFSEVVQALMVSSLDFHTFVTADGINPEAAQMMCAI